MFLVSHYRACMASVDKLLQQAEAHLDGEQVLAAVQGAYETKLLGSDSARKGILIATPRRIVFYAKKMGGYDLESYEYSKVSSFEQSKSMMGHTVTFFASGNKVSMKWIGDAAAMQKFMDAVKARSASTDAAPSPVPPAPTASPAAFDDKVGIIGAIKQLGDLHQAGILTDEEFSTKKAELLARL